jgi:hypothetical protein
MKRIENDNRRDHVARRNAPQTSDVASILASAKWYQLFAVLNGCILVFLFTWALLKALFAPAPTIKDEAIQDTEDLAKKRP